MVLGQITVFRYDGSGVIHAYDGVCNRQTKTVAGQAVTYTYDPANALTLIQPPTGAATTLTYDQNGNKTGENTGGALSTYTWDQENRLTKNLGSQS